MSDVWDGFLLCGEGFFSLCFVFFLSIFTFRSPRIRNSERGKCAKKENKPNLCMDSGLRKEETNPLIHDKGWEEASARHRPTHLGEGKVLRVLPSGRRLPPNQGWVNFWESRLVTVMKSLDRSATEINRALKKVWFRGWWWQTLYFCVSASVSTSERYATSLGTFFFILYWKLSVTVSRPSERPLTTSQRKECAHLTTFNRNTNNWNMPTIAITPSLSGWTFRIEGVYGWWLVCLDGRGGSKGCCQPFFRPSTTFPLLGF